MATTPLPNPPELLRLLAAATAGKIDPRTFEEAMGCLSGPERIFTLILEPDPADFHPEHLPEEFVSENRLEELRAGAQPTGQELRQWREALLEEARCGCGDGFHMVGAWRLPVSHGEPAICATLHEDQGVVVEVLGPFEGLVELRAALASRGIVKG